MFDQNQNDPAREFAWKRGAEAEFADPAPVRRPRRRRLRAFRARTAWRILRSALGVAAIISSGLLIYAWMGTAGAVRVAQQQAQAIREGRIEQAYELFSAEYQQVNSLPMFRAWVERHEQFKRAQQMRIWSRTWRRESAVLWGMVEDFRGQAYPIRYRLIREPGGWRIDGLEMRRSWAEESIADAPRAAYI